MVAKKNITHIKYHKGILLAFLSLPNRCAIQFVIDSLDKIRVLVENQHLNAIQIIEDNFLVYYSGKCDVFTNRGELLFSLPKNYSLIKKYTENLYIGAITDEAGEGNFIMIDIDNMNVLWRLNFYSGHIAIYKNSFITPLEFGDDSRKICAYSMHDGSERWRYTFDHEYNREDETYGLMKGYVYKHIANHAGIVWFFIASGYLIGLDGDTGERRYCITRANKPSNEAIAAMGMSTNAHLSGGLEFYDPEQQMLFGLRAKTYFELDLRDPENTFEVVDVRGELERCGFLSKANIDDRCSWLGDHILFITQDGEWGLFSRKQRCIVWSWHSMGEAGRIKPVNASFITPTKVVFHTRDRSLHIFDHPFALFD